MTSSTSSPSSSAGSGSGPRLVGLFTWDALGGERIHHREYHGSFIELPGPTRVPVRSSLELNAAGSRVAGRVVDGDGAARARVVLAGPEGATVYEVPFAPLVVAPRARGGVWLGAPGRDLVAWDQREIVRVPIERAAELIATERGVWVLSGADARFVDDEGHAHAESEWSVALRRSFASDDYLCYLDAHGGARHCLAPDGTRVDETAAASTSQRVPQGAGLDSSGHPFVSWRHGDHVFLAGRRVESLPLPVDHPPLRALPIIAWDHVTGDIIGYNDGRLVTWSSRRAVTTLVDEAAFERQVLPVQWSLPPAGIAGPWLAVSGPSGIAIIDTNGVSP